MPRSSTKAAAVWAVRMLWKACEYPMGIKTCIAIFVGCAIGIWKMGRTRNDVFLAMLIGPIGLAFVAAMLHKYPFGLRLLCFAIPAMLFLCAVAVDWLWESLPGVTQLAAPLLLLAMLGISTFKAAYSVIHPITVQEMKPMLGYIQAHFQPGDSIWVFGAAEPGFIYYALRYGLSARVIKVEESNAFQAVLQDISRWHGRVWLVRATGNVGVGVNDLDVVAAVNKAGRRVDAFSAPGVQAIAYQLPGR